MMLIMLMTMKKKAGWWFQYDQHPVCKDAKGQITSLNPQLKHNINFKTPSVWNHLSVSLDGLRFPHVASSCHSRETPTSELGPRDFDPKGFSHGSCVSQISRQIPRFDTTKSTCLDDFRVPVLGF